MSQTLRFGFIVSCAVLILICTFTLLKVLDRTTDIVLDMLTTGVPTHSSLIETPIGITQTPTPFAREVSNPMACGTGPAESGGSIILCDNGIPLFPGVVDYTGRLTPINGPFQLLVDLENLSYCSIITAVDLPSKEATAILTCYSTDEEAHTIEVKLGKAMGYELTPTPIN